jgi:hypothetical protein
VPLLFRVIELVKTKYYSRWDSKFIIDASPATGILYITDDSPHFISGHIRMRGRNNGKYPFRYLEMIDTIFGRVGFPDAIEVCCGGLYFMDAITVDINSELHPSFVDDGETLSKFEDNFFKRWRCDPPYNDHAARERYNTKLPKPFKLLEAGARVCKPGSLMFLLLGPGNYMRHPAGTKRIGWIAITVVPNNELRTLNIYQKI